MKQDCKLYNIWAKGCMDKGRICEEIYETCPYYESYDDHIDPWRCWVRFLGGIVVGYLLWRVL